MKLADTHYDNSETHCCARLDKELWDGQEHEWKDRLFLKDHIRAFLHIPLNFGSVAIMATTSPGPCFNAATVTAPEGIRRSAIQWRTAASE